MFLCLHIVPLQSKLVLIISCAGPQADVASWFSTQWHAVESSVQTIAELDTRLKEVEDLALDVQVESGNHPARNEPFKGPTTYIDTVICSHEFTDHCHQATLLEVEPSVPVFATQKAYDLIRSWKHFTHVTLTAPFSAQNLNWTSTSVRPLPEWIGISRIVTASDALYYHSAILVSFKLTKDDAFAEAIIYSPHGIVADDLRHLPQAKPPMKTLALMHGLHDVGISLAKQLNLGAHNGLKVQRACGAKYWVGTHDEVKKGGGLLAPFLRRTVLTIQEAIKQEKLDQSHLPGSSRVVDIMRDVRFAELKSGESILLE